MFKSLSNLFNETKSFFTRSSDQELIFDGSVLTNYKNQHPEQFQKTENEEYLDSSQYCYDSSYDWYIKIENNFGMVRYVNTYRQGKDKITDIRQIFDYIILPEDSPYEFWHIADREHLYDLNMLPEEYRSKSENPECFESESFVDRSWDSKNRGFQDYVNYL